MTLAIKPPLYAAETKAHYAVCVTGVTGYLGANLVARFLAAGHTVHGTVRDPAKAADIRALPGAAERLKLFKADLMKPDGFKEAMEGCAYVFHTASPYSTTAGYGDAAYKSLVEPAVKGTENVLGAVNEVPSVQRVVLTSSCAAVLHSYSEKPIGYQHTEKDWNTGSSLTQQPYNYSKTVAEKKAWELVKAQSRWDLVVINPPVILGPSVVNRSDGESIHVIKAIMKGEYSMMCPVMGFGFVDVRDVVAAHMLAAFVPTANGRNICCGTCREIADIVRICADLYPKQVGKPRMRAPKWLLLLLAPLLGVGRDILRANVGGIAFVSGAKAAKELGIVYTPLEETIKDMCEQCEKYGMLTIKK